VERYTRALQAFEPISLQEMDRVKLLDRTDTKYVFGEGLLSALLEEMREAYRLLEVNGVRGVGYRTLYYDTPELRYFHDHHNGRTFRSKVRYREYVGSDLFFLEVKRKTGRGRTSKSRIRVEGIPLVMPPEHMKFVQGITGVQAPHRAQLWNHFTRLTFVHRVRPERLTIDLGLTFEREGTRTALGPACIAELKQEQGDAASPFIGFMKSMGQRPSGMSKYCVGMWKLVPGMKYNTFKETLLKLARLQPAAQAISG
jgi:hypothetical protein